MKEITVLGIDLAKNVFQLHGVNSKGQVILKKTVRRNRLPVVISKLKSCLIGMESCPGSHYWAREFLKYGHKVRLIAPQYVKPYVKTNKNDYNDAEAICEAVTRPNMRFVSIKKTFHQDLECLIQRRDRLVRQRTALVNETRAYLHEYGVVISRSISQFRKNLISTLEQHQDKFSYRARMFFEKSYLDLKAIDFQIQELEKGINQISAQTEMCQRIQKIPGIGPITALSLCAATVDPNKFKNGRQFSAWIGLVPRQHSTGGKTRLLRISKRGNTGLRTLLIHGARAALRHAENKNDSLSTWIKDKAQTRGRNKACVALANKHARIVWALMAKGTEFKAA